MKKTKLSESKQKRNDSIRNGQGLKNYRLQTTDGVRIHKMIKIITGQKTCSSTRQDIYKLKRD